jgi:hypothetical protein
MDSVQLEVPFVWVGRWVGRWVGGPEGFRLHSLHADCLP